MMLDEVGLRGTNNEIEAGASVNARNTPFSCHADKLG